MEEVEPNKVGENVVGDGHGLSEEDESRINEVTEDLNDGRGRGIGAPVHQDEVHKPQLQPQRQRQYQRRPRPQQVLPAPAPPPPLPFPVVRGDRFLPVGYLKVLLVENDDSTRHVVNALLRNCSYEVIAVANGIEAWKILEDLTNHIDIVLTEVVMPCLSGIGLLGKIMSHKACKNIPVIMMSSHDSMGIVFNCLSKGAVDFLVKPIRKNELKNLWQHVWRRCHSSSGSGSGSESGVHTQKSVKPKNADDSDDNTGSNDEDDNASIGLNTWDGSDNGSGTQGSWTKHAAEPDSPQPSSPQNQLREAPDSICAQVIHPKPETLCNEWVPKTCSECEEQKDKLDDGLMEKDLEIGISIHPNTHLEAYLSEKASTKLSSEMIGNTKKNSPQPNDVFRGPDGSNAICELTTQAPDLIDTIAKSSMVTTSAHASNSLHKITEDKDKAIADMKELPSLELSLKRLRSFGDDGITSNDDRYVLRRSDQSAFSRYNTSAASNQKPMVHGGSYSVPFDNASDAVKMESKQVTTPFNQDSNGSCNVIDMGSTTNYVLNKPATFNQNVSSSSTKGLHTSSAFHPIKQKTCATQHDVPENIDDIASTKIMEEPRGAHQVQVQHHHPHYHHHHHHHHAHVAKQQLQQLQPSDNDELSMKNMTSAAPPCSSSNKFNGPVEANAGSCSLNGSVSGSNHGSNGQNGSSTMKPGGTNMEGDNGFVGKDEAGGCNGSGNGCGNGVDQNRFAQRVAALTKFRQKKKTEMLSKEGSLPKQEEAGRAAATCSWTIC
uniref:Two-component response regulator-like PRR73 n=1 Tax=Anthurium amnicola TaxID=1678845 RepID=A0A1D1XY64_9ARAE